MKITIGVLSVFLLLSTIGAPPVVEKDNKHKKDTDSKEDNSDEVVRMIIFFFLCQFHPFFS
jgi:hypothetical protein